MTRPQPITARIFSTAEEEEQGQEEEGKEMSDFKQSSDYLCSRHTTQRWGSFFDDYIFHFDLIDFFCLLPSLRDRSCGWIGTELIELGY